MIFSNDKLHVHVWYCRKFSPASILSSCVSKPHNPFRQCCEHVTSKKNKVHVGLWGGGGYHYHEILPPPLSMYMTDWWFDVLIVPLENRSLIWRRHHCRWRAENFELYSALIAIEQWGFFYVPHLLWHGSSVFKVISDDSWHSHPMSSVWQWNCNYLF